MIDLRDANTNPWYVLMTLHGEHLSNSSQRMRIELHRKNRVIWNAWSCQALQQSDAIALAGQAGIQVSETQKWNAIAAHVTARHQAEMISRNGRNFEYPGLPQVNQEIDCSSLLFENVLVLQSCILAQETNFCGSMFAQDANFLNATFSHGARFSNSKFKKHASFKSATFNQSASLREAKFLNMADFSRIEFVQDAYLSDATFAQNADFSGAIFGTATILDGASFQSLVTFQGGKSDGLVSFKGRANSRDLEKLPAHFAATTLFSEAHFSGRVNFYQRRFGPYDGDTKDLSFANAIFEGPVSFEEAAFPHVLPVLSNTTLPQLTKVSVEPGPWPDLPGPLAWIKATPPKGWEKTEQVKASAARLRHAMARQMLPEEEHFFFRYEMNAAALIGGFWQRLPYGLFGLASDFGHSILRPALWLLGVVVAFWLAYTFQFASDAVRLGGDVTTAEALALSFANTFSFFGFQRLYFGVDYINALPTWMRVAGAVQTVFGFVFLFFLGLGLRTRFRLR